MKILVVGSGGREHAIATKLSESHRCTKLFAAPGSDAIAQVATCVPIPVTDIAGLVSFAKEQAIDLTVVGPEIPLTLGLVDALEAEGLLAFGPTKRAAEIEGSKAFSKALMKKYGIATADFDVFTEVEPAQAFARQCGYPVVIKADGLAAGKGVVIAQNEDEANATIEDMLSGNAFGSAGARIVIEEFLDGEEVSVLAFSDGQRVVPMVSSQDHKRIYDHDEGPNTGGMGAYSPAPVYTDEDALWVKREVLQKTVNAMAREGRPFKGVLYAGLMLTKKGIKVLEFNARFGDPETQPVLMRLKNDLVDVMERVAKGRIDGLTLMWDKRPAICVIMASAGYPTRASGPVPIEGLERLSQDPTVKVFHSGTRKNEDGQWETHGGRVLGVCALGETLREAYRQAYAGVEKIHFTGAQYRHDIGAKAFAHEASDKALKA